MAEEAVQTLGVKITEDKASTAAVVSSLDRVEKKIGDLQKSAASDRASMAESAAANRTLATSVEGLAGSLEKKFAATDKVLSVLGKATGVIGLVVGVVTLGKQAWDFFTDAEAKAQKQTEATNRALDQQLGKLRAVQTQLKGFQDAPSRLAGLAGVGREALTAEESREAQQRELDRLEISEKLTAVLEQESEAELAVARARAQGAFSGRQEELDRLTAQRESLSMKMEGLRIDEEVAAANIREREGLDRKAPGGGGGGGGGGQGPTSGLRNELANYLGQTAGKEERGAKTFAPEQIETLFKEMEKLDAGAPSTASEFEKMAERMAAAAEQAQAPLMAFFAGLSESASAALVDVLIFGESAEQMANGLAKAFARQALAQVPIEIGRWHAATGLALLGHPTAAAAAVAHLDAALTFAAAGVGGLGVAALTGGIRGGGGGGGGGTGPAAGGGGGLGRRLPDEGGGANVTVNVDYRGASIETGDDIARNVMGFVRRGMTMLGGPGLPADDGRNRRRPR